MKPKNYISLPNLWLRSFIIFTFIFLCKATFTSVFAQSNKFTKVSSSVVASTGNVATVAGVVYTYTIGEPFIFTGTEPSGFLTQGFNQPMICKTFPTIVALNQTSCTLPYSLSVANGFDRYVWKKDRIIGKSTIANGTAASYEPVLDGNYTVTVMDSTGCILVSAPVVVDLSSKNIVPTISVYGTATKDTLLESSDANDYQWYVLTPSDGVYRAIVGETTKTYAPIYNGTYYVKINTQEQCVAYSSTYTVNNVGFEPINKGGLETTDSTIWIVKNNSVSRNLQVYPIPTKDKLNIKYETSETNTVEFNIYDLKGVLVDSRMMKGLNGKMNWVYQNTDLPTGKYILRVVDGSNSLERNLIFE